MKFSRNQLIGAFIVFSLILLIALARLVSVK